MEVALQLIGASLLDLIGLVLGVSKNLLPSVSKEDRCTHPENTHFDPCRGVKERPLFEDSLQLGQLRGSSAEPIKISGSSMMIHLISNFHKTPSQRFDIVPNITAVENSKGLF